MNESVAGAARSSGPVNGDNLTGFAGYSRVTLMIYLGATLLGVIPTTMTMLAAMQILSYEFMFITAGISGLLGFASMLLFVAAMIGILLWLHRARQNLVDAGLEELRYSPGWSVGSFFVPFVNFVVPFLSMRELYNRSHGEIPELAQSSVSSVASWWTCHVVGSLVLIWTSFVLFVELVPGIFWTTPPAANAVLSLFGSLLMAGSAWFLFKIIGSITEAQRSMLHVSDTFA